MWKFYRKGHFAVILEDNNVLGKEMKLYYLDKAMNNAGLIRWNWDYEKASYDLKMEDEKTNLTYYLRVLAVAIEGELENARALLKLEVPVIGKHLFPHGFDYDAEIPAHIVDLAKEHVARLEAALH